MASAHILPGYGNPVSRMRRVHSAYPLDKTKLKEFAIQNVPPLEQRELDRIRQNARGMWTLVDRQPTTYNFFHAGRTLDEPTKLRPAEPERRHKPHPQPVFLSNRLHYIEGYQNPDARLGKEVYQVDASRPYGEQVYRNQAREKYRSRPHTAAVNQYRDEYAVLKETFSPREAQGAQAWLKIADDKDQEEFVHAVSDFRNKEMKVDARSPVHASPRPNTATGIPASLHRWMKQAGPLEQQNLRNFIDLTHANPSYLQSTIRPLYEKAGDVQEMRKKDIDAVKNARYVHKPIRGDFLIHPEWPPTMPHHRV